MTWARSVATGTSAIARMKSLRIQSALGLLFRPCTAAPSATAPGRRNYQARWAHKSAQVPSVPAPTPFVPDVETFLTLIGRGLKQHASKFPTWEALFTLTSDQLKELGVEPPRTRRYLLKWRQRFRKGIFGAGGNFQHVENGTAELRIHKIYKDSLVCLRRVVNVPPGKTIGELEPSEMVKAKGYGIKANNKIVGPYAMPMRGGARVTMTEGMWEDRRGRKVDGGERRKDEIRFKKRVAKRKALREAQGFY